MDRFYSDMISRAIFILTVFKKQKLEDAAYVREYKCHSLLCVRDTHEMSDYTARLKQ